jgi:hypothetical protein
MLSRLQLLLRLSNDLAVQPFHLDIRSGSTRAQRQ